jgi:pilus assembly protein CpaF
MEMRSAHCSSATGKLQASALAGVKPDSSALHAATLKQRERIIDEFNLTALEKIPPDELAKQVRAYVGGHIRRESVSLNQKELDLFSNEIIAEMTGYGPFKPLSKDPTVTDILINMHKRCFIEGFGQLQETKGPFQG